MKRLVLGFVALCVLAASVSFGPLAHAVGGLPGAVAQAQFVNPASFLPIGNPTKVAMGGAASSSTTVGKGLGLSIYCTVDATFKTGVGAQTATADSVQLPAGQTRVGALYGSADSIAFYTASAGTCYLSTTGG